MNLILRDVEEVYSPRPVNFGDNRHDESNVEAELGRRRRALRECNTGICKGANDRWCIRKRTMKQILVRGDNVVLVYKADNERSTWPNTTKSPTKSRYSRPVELVPEDQRVGSPGSLTYALARMERKNK